MNRKIKQIIEITLKKIRLRLKDNLVSIVLFGSYPRGIATEKSDIDMMIVVKRIPKTDLLKQIKYDVQFKFEKKLDITMLSKRDVIDNFIGCTPLFSTLILGNKILYDKNNFFKKQFINFVKQLDKTNIKYCEAGRIWDIPKLAQDIVSSL